MNDPFLNGKNEVTGMDMFQLYSGIVCMQKNECPVGQQRTEMDSPSDNFFIKILVIPYYLRKSASHMSRSGTLAHSVYRSIGEQTQPCGK